MSNYQISGTQMAGTNAATVTGTGTITPAVLSATGSQVYNGTTTFNGSNLTVDGVNGQTFTATGTGTLGNFGNVQASQQLASVSGLTLSGNGGALASNYTSLTTGDTLVSVTHAPLSVTADSSSKIYGSANPVIGVTYSGFVGGQGTSSLTTTPTTATTATTTSNVGSYATIASGAVDPNYSFNYVNGALAITPAPLTLSGSGVYNGTTILVGSDLTATGVHGQTFSVGGTGAGDMFNPNVQPNPVLLANVTNLTLGTSGNGGLSGNYQGLSTVGSSVNFIPATLTLTVTGVTPTNRVYNGTMTDVLTGATISGMIAPGNILSLTNSTTGILGNNGNVGKDSLTTAMGLSGTGSGNYTLSQEMGLTAVISPKPLTASVLANKVYDGTNTADLSGSNTTFTGFVNGQGASVDIGVTGTYAQSGVGTGIRITGGPLTAGSITANSGTNLSNYILPIIDNGIGNITLGSFLNLNSPVLRSYGNVSANYGPELAGVITETSFFTTNGNLDFIDSGIDLKSGGK